MNYRERGSHALGPNQGLASAEDLNIELPEGRESSSHTLESLDWLTNLTYGSWGQYEINRNSLNVYNKWCPQFIDHSIIEIKKSRKQTLTEKIDPFWQT